MKRQTGSIASVISHDLRAPLRSMEGFSAALLDDYNDQLDETAQLYLKRVVAGAHKLDEMMLGLVRLSRVSCERLMLESVDLGELTAQLVQLKNESNLEAKIQLETNVNAPVQGGRKQLKELMTQLVDNAVNFSSDKTQVKLEFGFDEGKSAYFLRDEGVGFDQAQVEHVFAPFKIGHSGSGSTGLGLGLSIAQRVIDQHGGNIWIETEKDAGTTVFFTL